MDQIVVDTNTADRRRGLLDGVRRALPEIRALAALRDADAGFPETELGLLADCGALAAPVPGVLGGLGFGTEAAAAADAAELLRLVGTASLPLGRVFEGHVNAIRLICRLGTPQQARRAAQDARAGHLHAVWNTDPAQAPLVLTEAGLAGAKILASAAGYATRALVTTGEPRLLLLVDLLRGAGADLAGWTAQGMHASATGRVAFDGIGPDRFQVIGAPDGYLAQPDFSGGAWRASAVALGGLDALVDALRDGLRRRGRHGDPHQLARLGGAFIAQETAHLWVGRAAALAEADALAGADALDAAMVVAYVGLARLAVESACLDAMRLAQRSLGLAAFMRPEPVERICRDLATYLRQPAPDETLTAAAAHFVLHDLPR